MKSQKVVMLFFVVVMVTGILTACSGGKVTENSQSNDSKGETKGQKNIVRLWHGLTEVELPKFEEMTNNFNEQSKTTEVELVYIPREELLKQLTIGNLAGDMADMALIDNPDTAGFAASGVLEDVTELYNNWSENQMLEGPINSAIYDEKIYGVPYAYNNLALFYDKDMLSEAGVEVPTTWDELSEAAQKLTTKEHYGFAFCSIKNEEGTFQYIPFLTSAGGSFDKMDSTENIKTLTFLYDMIAKDSVSREVISWTQADIEKQFATGKTAMMINGPWNIPQIQADAPDKNWGVAYIPKDKDYSSCLGGENLCITKGANKDTCWEFIEYLCGKKINATFCKSVSKFSPRSDVDNEELYKDDEILKVFSENMENAKARGPHPLWTQISTDIQIMMQEVFTGAKTPEQAANDAQAKINVKLMKQ